MKQSPHPPTLLLTPDDLDLAERVAQARHRTEGIRDDADLVGAVGEVAMHRIFLPWFDLGEPATIHEVDDGWDFTMPDGLRVDVKTITGKPDKLNLLVPKMPRAGVYVLTHWDQTSGVVTFLGWITGGRASVEGRIASWGKHYLVAPSSLATFRSFLSRYNPDHPRAVLGG